MKGEYLLKHFSLRNRIFLSLILLSVISSILISAVSVHQFKKEAHTYHQYRQERKEASIIENINYILTTSSSPLKPEFTFLIFKDRIQELAMVHNTTINIYDLNGKLLISSAQEYFSDNTANKIPLSVLLSINSSTNHRFVDIETSSQNKTRTAYSFIKDKESNPLAIIKIPYQESTEFYDSEIRNFTLKFGQVYIIMLILSIGISYFLSNYITQNLNNISFKITKTKLGQKNEKIESTSTSKEISTLISAYNKMVEKLDESYEKLAQSEREQAWREMAKQVAHEIKNPLTPMRLSVQNFERRFDSSDPDIKTKVQDFTQGLIQQIDTMSSVASAFSSFASMPAQRDETLNVVKTVLLALDIFNEPYIKFKCTETEIISKIDRTQLIRIITNLVKNAIQAIPTEKESPLVIVNLSLQEENVVIEVIDNGKGIPTEIQSKIFEPKFTTKTNGMGLGLGIIKNIVENYSGTITFDSESNKGTIFTVKLPIVNN
jgi:signal transduction histidine kinase